MDAYVCHASKPNLASTKLRFTFVRIPSFFNQPHLALRRTCFWNAPSERHLFEGKEVHVEWVQVLDSHTMADVHDGIRCDVVSERPSHRSDARWTSGSMPSSMHSSSRSSVTSKRHFGCIRLIRVRMHIHWTKHGTIQRHHFHPTGRDVPIAVDGDDDGDDDGSDVGAFARVSEPMARRRVSSTSRGVVEEGIVAVRETEERHVDDGGGLGRLGGMGGAVVALLNEWWNAHAWRRASRCKRGVAAHVHAHQRACIDVDAMGVERFGRTERVVELAQAKVLQVGRDTCLCVSQLPIHDERHASLSSSNGERRTLHSSFFLVAWIPEACQRCTAATTNRNRTKYKSCSSVVRST